jgi:EAL domain-containing protein (putative c-di-GMP-specific phosphodiesterase class I)/GGDEF domain-containing protein
MSLGRRVALLMAAVVLLSLLGGLVVQTLVAREALQRELQRRSLEAAHSLAQVLAEQLGDTARMQALVVAQVELGSVRSIVLTRPDGVVILEASPAPRAPAVPGWFMSWLPLSGVTAHADILHGHRLGGSVRVEPRTAWAHEALWASARLTASWLAGVALFAATLSAYLLRGWNRPLQDTVAQAQALEQGRFVEAEEPHLPELRLLTRSMNATVRRLREVFTAQAEQVQLLQRQALLDGVTTLPLRGQFTGRLETQLAGGGGPGVAMILMRVLDLDALNQRLGHEATDRLLVCAASLLQAYVDGVPGTFAGRLNGADFALCLPASGLAAETAGSLHAALAAAPALHAGAARIVVGAVDAQPGMNAGAVLAAADAALALAEAEGGLAIHDEGQAPADLAGSRAWRGQIGAALSEGRTQLAECAVRGRDGQIIHLECELRVQFSPGSDYQGAARWLALARRSQLLPRVDLAALSLALAATAADGQRRAVHMAPASLAIAGYVADVTAMLREAPAAARRLAIEWVGANPLAEADTMLVQAAQQWRDCGAHLGVELTGAQIQHVTRASELGIDYIKLATRHLHGAVNEEAMRSYAAGLVSLVHGLGLLVLAQGVDRQEELAMLWELGFDGAAGQALETLKPQMV